MSQSDLTIWKYSNSPLVIFELPFDIAGSDFELLLRFGGRVLTRRLSNAQLTADEATGRVTWHYSPADFADAPTPAGVYEFWRIVAGGERRIYAFGKITVRSTVDV